MTAQLVFDGRLLQVDGKSFDARNNVASNSNGPWPKGTFRFHEFVPHQDTAGSEFGTIGNYKFIVPGRTHMGIHGGRANVADKRGRKGIEHCTKGCIRTTDNGVAAVGAHIAKYGRERVTLVVK